MKGEEGSTEERLILVSHLDIKLLFSNILRLAPTEIKVAGSTPIVRNAIDFMIALSCLEIIL